MSFRASSSVIADQSAVRAAVALTDTSWQISPPSVLRALADIFFDWTIIIFATWATYQVGACMTVLALFAIGNRQRALGNLLHEASHQNLSARRKVNDRIGRILLAPALFSDFTLYRLQHARHHAWLGDPIRDPDYLPRAKYEQQHWFSTYARVLCDPANLTASLLGHLVDKRLSLAQWLAITLWWVAYEAVLDMFVGMHFAILFLALWIAAKASVFHAITIFREMIDHYALESGGIFRHTRETPSLGLLSVLIHPHHNGYHLTHHLFPRIPYYDLPRAHAHLHQVSFFNERSIVCEAYLKGSRSSVNGWRAS
ncbi:fatty acid desaturase [Burkholderia sp. PAMC 26561]|uniref:fatty acid desaturase n=1 Tax=Burkholderia sp. PAMC 26561 TaxID=1795043 RepID=UPI00076B0ACA|nr:fatty acid desaturase [Burkholderia sp. PAMC 26561]AME26283.1 fatty acid desaturase [Burkholderia sp. PAMC 26561]